MDDELRKALQAFYDGFTELADDATPEPGASLVGWKPIHSTALGVHPKRRQEAIDDAKAKGVPTNFDATNRPVLRTRQHRREYMKAYGFHDNQGGYGDG